MTTTTSSSAPAPAPDFNLGYDNFVAYLRDPETPGAAISPKRFSQALHMDLQTLAAQAHVHRSTIIHAPASGGVQRFLCDALRVIKAGTDISGDVGRTLFWYRHDPLPAFGYKTPEQLLADGRAEDLLRYVASLEAGAS